MSTVEQKWPTELVIIRHGQSARNVQKNAAKKAGSTADYSDGVRDQDTPLTDIGIIQSEATGRAHRGKKIDVILCSPYLRTRQTKDRFIYGLGGVQPKVVIEERIREIEFGIMDGLTPDGMKAKFPEEVARKKREGKYWYRAPGGESRPDVRLRVHSVLNTLTRDYREKHVYVFCHSVVVLAFRSLLERWGEEEYMIVDKENDVLNCGITRYLFDKDLNKLLLAEYNRIYWDEASD